MKLLRLTLPSAAENLALDEALLERAEAESESGSDSHEVLRLWESPQAVVVMGRSSEVKVETRSDACRQEGVPILRRCSGGATIVAGQGCLMFGVVLSIKRNPALRMIDQAHQFVMLHQQRALESIGISTQFQGNCDLTIEDKKFSGNSLRCKRNYLLYHGTLLYDFDLDRVSQYLGTPPRQPDYRRQRSHAEFITNLPASREELEQAMIRQWGAVETGEDWPRELTRQLVDDRYSSDSWNFKR